jgi:transcriptional regulator with XRE-family HTH domain
MTHDAEDASTIFPDRLRKARDKRELSQSQLAEKAGLPPSSISHFESGARKPSFDNLRRLANALNVSTDYLLGRVDQMDSIGPAERIHRHLENLSARDVELADEFLEMLKRRGGSS